MLGSTAHTDTFARDKLPPPEQWPNLLPGGFEYPERLNAAVELTDRMTEVSPITSRYQVSGGSAAVCATSPCSTSAAAANPARACLRRH